MLELASPSYLTRPVRFTLDQDTPRLVQQALYSFCSKSNRQANGIACSTDGPACSGCVLELCPFHPASMPR